MHRAIPLPAIHRAACVAEADDIRLDRLHKPEQQRALAHYTEQAQLAALLAEKDALLRQALEALERAHDFIAELGSDLHHRRIGDWYPEGANNAALAMSEDMRLIGNQCADFEDATADAIRTHLGPEAPAPELIPGVKAALNSLGVGK